MWEIVSTFGLIAAVYACFHALQWITEFFGDPEQTLERLGGLVGAFRRGLAGKSSGRAESPVSPPGADSRQSE
jgi:hypothetical protein